MCALSYNSPLKFQNPIANFINNNELNDTKPTYRTTAMASTTLIP